MSGLLPSKETIDLSFDDHSHFISGTISSEQAIKSSLCSSFLGIFLVRGFYHRSDSIGSSHLSHVSEVRPYSPLRFRTNSVGSIITRLYSLVLRLNEFSWNSIGLCFRTSRMLVYSQILLNNCISMRLRKGNILSLQKNSLSKNEIQSLYRYFTNIFPCFQKLDEFIEPFDSHHIMGGLGLLEEPIILNLIDSGHLRILGSPSKKFKLTFSHHTVNVQDLVSNDNWDSV